MNLSDLQKVIEIDRRRDRYVDQLTKLERFTMINATCTGSNINDQVTISCTVQNEVLFAPLKAVIVEAWKCEIRRADDELRALGVEV